MPYRQKYFYTVLFLDDYFPERREYDKAIDVVEAPVLKSFEISKDTNSETIKWLDENTLYVRHNLQLPITLEMWNNEGKPIFYTPLLKEGIDSISVGQIVIESSRSIKLIFNEDVQPPQEGEIFKLSIKTLPSFDTTSSRLAKDVETVGKALDETINVNKCGLAVIFRRHSLDSHFDLEVELDESYLHSMAESSDYQYMTRLSNFNSVKWLTKYTDNLQDVIDDINASYYEIKYSWKENGSQWWSKGDPFGYQKQRGHLPPQD